MSSCMMETKSSKLHERTCKASFAILEEDSMQLQWVLMQMAEVEKGVAVHGHQPRAWVHI